MDRLDAMTALLAVVDTGSFSAASRKLRVPLTTVSRRISELETHLATRLLHRTTRRVTMTDAGAPYVAVCRRVLEEIDEAERAAGGEYQAPRGELSVTAPLVLGRLHVVPVAAEFMQEYPDIRLTCRFNDRVLDLQEEHIDIAVRIGHLADSRQRARRIGTIRRLVCASPDYLARRGTPRSLDDLADHDCVGFHGFDPPGGWTFSTEDGPVTVPIRSRIALDTMESVVDAGVAGMGLVRVFCYHVRPALRAGTLTSLRPSTRRPACRYTCCTPAAA